MTNPFTTRPLPPADQLMRDYALREEGARSAIEALRPLLKSVTFTAEGRRVIPVEIVEALLAGNTVPEKPAFVRKCEGKTPPPPPAAPEPPHTNGPRW